VWEIKIEKVSFIAKFEQITTQKHKHTKELSQLKDWMAFILQIIFREVVAQKVVKYVCMFEKV